MSDKLNHLRLLELSQKVQTKTASKKEKDEYMDLLFNNGSITEKQYRDFKAGRNTEDIIDAALVIGGIVILGYLLDKLIK